MSSVLLYKYYPILVHIIAIFGALGSGWLVYSGLTNRYEKIHHRLRFKQSILEQKNRFVLFSKESRLEIMLKQAGYPLNITALKYNIFHMCLSIFLALNYLIVPYYTKGTFSMVTLGILFLVLLLTVPLFPYAAIYFLLKRLIDYKNAKRNAELFVLYDLLTTEIQMMETSRINAYNLLRDLRPYFTEIEDSLNRLLTDWNKDKGHVAALDAFAKEINTSEAEALVTVLKTFDENSRKTILESLRGMEEVFANAQIENYRRRRKLFVDLARIPIKTAHFLIILNFVVVIVFMVSVIMRNSHM